MNRTEYDLGAAAKDRKLKEVELVDFEGRTVHRIFWEPRFVSFKAFKFQNVIYRFGFVFNWTVYYQRTDILDLDKAPIVPWEVMPDDIYRLKERHDEVHKVMDVVKQKEAAIKRKEAFISKRDFLDDWSVEGFDYDAERERKSGVDFDKRGRIK